MKFIAGEFRSRRLKSIRGDGTRPTPDRLRDGEILEEARRDAVEFVERPPWQRRYGLVTVG